MVNKTLTGLDKIPLLLFGEDLSEVGLVLVAEPLEVGLGYSGLLGVHLFCFVVFF